MPYVNKPRPYKHEYDMQQARGENPERAKRAAARRGMDAKGIDRGGKVIDHIKPLSKGGTNSPSNLKLTSRAKNASFSRNSDHTVKQNVPKKK
jgi:hypothetical protein